jgi:hypothetical protein
MNAENPNATAKLHPASREMLVDDPLEMYAFEVPGDPTLMLRLLVEEYARMGWDADAIMQLARDPNYQAFYALWRTFGDSDLKRLVHAVIARCRIMRVTFKETEPLAERLVQLDLPA